MVFWGVTKVIHTSIFGTSVPSLRAALFAFWIAMSRSSSSAMVIISPSSLISTLKFWRIPNFSRMD